MQINKLCNVFLVTLAFLIMIPFCQAQEVFNTPPTQTFSNSNMYGAPTSVHSPEYYNNLITTSSHQKYQALVASNQAKQNDPQLKALQEKMLNSSNSSNSSNNTNNSQSLLTGNNTSAPQQATPPQPASPPPQPNVIYQTPIANSNNTATNFNSSSNNSSNSSNSNNSHSGSGNLDIQY